MALQGGQIWRNEEIVSFPLWDSVLAREVVDKLTKETHRRAIMGFLGFCQTRRAAASVLLAKEYIERRELQAGRREEWLRAGLRWFFQRGRKQEVAPLQRAMEEKAPKAAEDLGGADWERDLIAAVRRKGFLWRTEQTVPHGNGGRGSGHAFGHGSSKEEEARIPRVVDHASDLRLQGPRSHL